MLAVLILVGICGGLIVMAILMLSDITHDLEDIDSKLQDIQDNLDELREEE